jgi:hypothetical protein
MLALIALMTACGSASNEQTVTDSVVGNGIDSSVILPALTDSVGTATTDTTAHIPAQ